MSSTEDPEAGTADDQAYFRELEERFLALRGRATLLSAEDSVTVEIIRTNAPYRPGWVGGIKFLRAPARLGPYLLALWAGIGRADVVHLFANSGWAWHLFAAPAILVSRIRARPIIVNYRGGGAAEFMEHAPRSVSRALKAADSLVVPSGFLRGVFERFGVSRTLVGAELHTNQYLGTMLLTFEDLVFVFKLIGVFSTCSCAAYVGEFLTKGVATHLSA